MLVDLFRALPAAGADGLEGLTAVLLADALGLEARLEASGAQRGRDIGLFDRKTGAPANIDIEVKRYGAGNVPTLRMLLGELTEVRRARPQTRLWVIVATTSLPAAHVDTLQDEGFRNDIDVLILDCMPGTTSSLDLLAASREAVVLRWISQWHEGAVEQWQVALAAVREEPAYEVQRADLAEQLTSRYAANIARERARAWLSGHVHSRRQRIIGLNQSLGRLGRAPQIPRPRIDAGWRAWLEAKRAQTGVLALLGGEGDGKTWTAIDALLADPSRTPLIATSNMFDDGGAPSLIATALAQQCGGDPDRWRRRLEAKQGSMPSDFRLLLLIDGLNEAPRRHMDRLIGEMLEGPWGDRLDVIVTCRTHFWERQIAPYLLPQSDRIETVTVGPFDYADEWPVARAHLGQGVTGLPATVAEALRNPRLWGFAYDLKNQIGGLTEITLERLLVEHWRLRIAEREEMSVDPETFNRLIGRSIDIIRNRSAGNLVDVGELEAALGQMVGSSTDVSAVLADLQDGVFFRTARDRRLALRPERVPVALGLLLTERLVAAVEQDDPAQAVIRATAAFLDDLPASDRVELIVRTAIFAVLSMPGDRRHLLPVLLRQWVSLQNFEADFYRALAIVAAAAPEDCIHAIEDEACEEVPSGDVGAELSTALKGRRDRPNVCEAMHVAARRWLSSYSSEHFPAIGRLHPDTLLPSTISWVETLDDYAAAFLANLPAERWPTALANWARRRIALEKQNPDIYHYDDALAWLGMSGSVTDEEAEAAVDRLVAATDPRPTPAEADLFRQLLDGSLFHDRSQAHAHEIGSPFWQEVEREVTLLTKARAAGEHPPIHDWFVHLYEDGSARGSESWMKLESAILSLDATLLPDLVRRLLRQAVRRSRGGADLSGFPQFARDHALLLGRGLLKPVEHFLAATHDTGPEAVRLAARAQEATQVVTGSGRRLQPASTPVPRRLMDEEIARAALALPPLRAEAERIRQLASTAASPDDCPEGARLLRNFEDYIVSHAGADWRSPDEAAPARGFSGAADALGPSGRTWDFRVMMDRTTVGCVLDALEAWYPGYRAKLLERSERISDGSLVVVESRAGLLSALADRDPVAAVAAMARLHAKGHGRVDHKGLLVGDTVRFVFVHDQPEVRALRDRIADAAWSDHDCLDLVCLAELEGRQEWLNRRIEADQASSERGRRARGHLLRGWRGSRQDREWLDVEQPGTGYDRFAIHVARCRAERRREMGEAMDRYGAAATDEEAWLAYRLLLHRGDRRLLVEAERRNWPDSLPRARAINHQLAVADFEWLIARVEFEPDRRFAAVSYPASLPPWERILIYGKGEG